MTLTRRSFLAGTGAGALAALAHPIAASARGLLTDPTLDAVIERALSAATRAGATYADVRVVRQQREALYAREDKLVGVESSDSYGIGVRVLAGGAWGFASTPRVTPAEAARIATAAVGVARANAKLLRTPVVLAPEPAHVDVWQTPMTKDPFKIPLEDKVDLLLALNREVMAVPGVRFAASFHEATSEWKRFASSEGASIEQRIVRIGPGYEATAIDDKLGTFASRAHDLPPRQAGWEYVTDSSLLADARRIGQEAVEKLRAPSVTAGPRDLVIAPSNLWLTVHESIGHPTELDRALGYEANFAGTSFATPDLLHKLQLAAPHLTFYADKTTPGGLATCGYDDDGVATQRWNLVERGVFVGYQTTREQAAWIGEPRSRGTAYADGFGAFPFQRMPNVSLAPGARTRSLDDLVAATDDGILIIGRGSWSIDHQRKNFQFGNQLAYEIKRGRRTRMLKDVAYHASTIQFWNACDLVGGADSWELGGAMADGKGEPVQLNPISHGCPPARFKQIDVVNTGRP
ncbi:MAG: TldD/PmbA family protein [Deltaproteobacteria bacterium]|nr:TldD/PmbA family protein [Deltaproteobacteria bacterium]